jgi:hypothetical protein
MVVDLSRWNDLARTASVYFVRKPAAHPPVAAGVAAHFYEACRNSSGF